MARRRRNPPDLYHHTTAEKAARIYREQRLRSAGEPDVYVTTADYDIGYGPVAVPIYVPAKVLQLDDEFPDGRKDYRIRTKGGSAPVYAGKPFPVRKPNPAGRLLQFPLREIRVEAFPSPLSNGWLLRLHINGQDVKDAVRDIKTGQARVFDSSAKAAAWWKKHGQAFVDAMGRAACVRTRKANPAREYGAGPVWVGSAVRPWRLVVFEDGRQTERHVSDARGKTLQFDTAQAAMAWWKKNGQKWVNRQPNPCSARKSNPSEGERARDLARELGISITKARRELSRRHRASESAGEKLARRIARETRQSSTEAATLAEVRAIIDELSSNGWATVHQSDSGSVYLRSPGGRVLRISDHFVPLAHARGAKRRGGADAELVWTGRRGAVTPAQLRAELATILAEWGETGGRQGNPAGSPFAAEVARLRSDPTLQSASMRQHLRNVAKAPGSGRQQAVGGRKKQSRRAGWRGGRSVLEPVYSVRARRSVRSVEKPRRRVNPKTRLEDYLRSQARGKAARRLPSEIAKLRREIGDKRAARSRQRYGSLGHGRYDWDYGPAALRRRLAVRREKAKLDAFVRQWTGCPASRYWSASDLDKVRKEAQYESRGIGGDVAAAAARATIAAMVRRMVKRGWTLRHTSRDGGRATSRYLRKGDFEVRLSDHRVPETAEREYRGPARWWDFEELNPCADVEAQIMYIEAHREGRTPNPKSKIRNPKSSSPFAAEVARLRSDPTLQSASMRQHLRNVAKAPGSGRPRRSAAAREWKEFAGYEPNHVEKIDGVALKGNLPGVRVDVLEGVGAETGRRVKIDAGQKPLYLVWFKSGERFAVTGGPSAMRELARDFSRLSEPIYLTKVDYVAPRYPVPEGVRRTKANAELSIAFTHAVENPTLMTWNGKLDPEHARFDIRVKGRRRRWVNRSGLIF